MDIGEAAMIGLLDDHIEDDCAFCAGGVATFAVSNDVEDPDEDSELIGNDSGALDTNMGLNGSPRPTTWAVALTGMKTPKPVGANPHHLIPGDASLKQSPALLTWIFADKGKITGDLGYDVNRAPNGVWLPSNNAWRGVQRWKNDKPPVRLEYASKAMVVSGGHFHDSHEDPYSNFVARILNKLADRLNHECITCPALPAAAGPWPPPAGLIGRLDGVSARLRFWLTNPTDLTPFIYTSDLVLRCWLHAGNDMPMVL